MLCLADFVLKVYCLLIASTRSSEAVEPRCDWVLKLIHLVGQFVERDDSRVDFPRATVRHHVSRYTTRRLLGRVHDVRHDLPAEVACKSRRIWNGADGDAF